METVQPARDQWAQWLLERRHGGDAATQKALLDELARVRNKVLEHASLGPGDVLLDVGCGDGLIAFGALPLVGEQGRVIFSNVSADLLALCRERAEQLDMAARCAFLQASADDLSALDAASIDVVTTRSVLIYVAARASEAPAGPIQFCDSRNSPGRLLAAPSTPVINSR